MHSETMESALVYNEYRSFNPLIYVVEIEDGLGDPREVSVDKQYFQSLGFEYVCDLEPSESEKYLSEVRNEWTERLSGTDSFWVENPYSKGVRR